MNWMDGSMMDGLQLVAKNLSFLISSMAPKTCAFFDLQTCLGKRYWLSRPPPLRDNMPHGLLSRTLLRFVSSALSHKMFFFCPNLRCKVIEPMVKSQYLVRFRVQKKKQNGFKIWVVSKRSLVPKIGPAPALA